MLLIILGSNLLVIADPFSVTMVFHLIESYAAENAIVVLDRLGERVPSWWKRTASVDDMDLVIRFGGRTRRLTERTPPWCEIPPCCRVSS